MKIHLSQCPLHPSQIGRVVLQACYCKASNRPDATAEELVQEFADLPAWKDCSRAQQEYADAIVAAICALEVRHA